jgi:hypothetical protein
VMMNAFYKVKPVQDTPYRQLSISYKDGWKLRLTGGTKWGREDSQELKSIPAQSFDEAKELYDKMFIELQEEGWKAYSPQESWD